MEVAIYIRVSTQRQAVEGYSLDAQRKTLTEYCYLHKHSIYKIYADEGISGKDVAHREEFKKMLSDAENKKFDLVLVWKLTRFTRSLKDLISTCEKLDKLGIGLVSYSESFDTSTPSGRMMRNLLGVIAQWEREIISENVQAANLEKVEQGYSVCSRILGYDHINKDLIINKNESAIVTAIFTAYLKNPNLSAVTDLINKKGYKGKDGKVFSPSSIATILSNPTYCGLNRYHGKLYKGRHKPIIPKETFNVVQRLMATAPVGRKRKHKLTSL